MLGLLKAMAAHDDKNIAARKTIRINKKQMWINSLEHDINYYEGALMDKSTSFFWHHGERVFKLHAKGVLVEMKQELKKINEDKTYKPWKGL